MTRKNVGFTFHLIFYGMQRCLLGVITDDETWCFQYDPEKKIENAVENTEFTSA
jgi:hypothetical protein